MKTDLVDVLAERKEEAMWECMNIFQKAGCVIAGIIMKTWKPLLIALAIIGMVEHVGSLPARGACVETRK